MSTKHHEAGGHDLLGHHDDSNVGDSSEINLSGAQKDQLQRGLKSRHIQFLALSGAIGTGLFIGSGGILAATGPASLFLAYVCMILVVWVVMDSLAEMVTYLPLRGVTIPYLVGRFVDPSVAFTAGWNYWFAYAILIGAESTAAGIIVEYWKPPVNVSLWIAIILAVELALNIVAVSYYGEAEFWFSSIKFITILGLIIVGIIIFFGGGPNQHSILGFSYWKNPGAFIEYGATGNLGRFLGFWYAFIQASFAVLLSAELIAIAAGETMAPRRNIPKAARRFAWRLVIFYGLSSLIVGIVVPSTDKHLLGASDASASPFVIGIQNVGIPALNHIINAGILTSAWSTGNSFVFSGSRVLYSLAKEGSAPRIFQTTNKKGVPWVAVLTTWSVGLLAFMNVSNSGAVVFNWLVNIIIGCGFISWIIICITYLRFRRAMQYNGLLHTLPYQSRLQPYKTWVVLVVVIILTITKGFQVFLVGKWDAKSFVAAYITLPIMLAIYVGHKIWSRTPFYIPTKDIDVLTGKREMDELEAMDEPRVAKNWVEKVWYWIA
ncbi:Proline utilization trans-activator [Purpureocillium lavendulum]|uniref:Proline utilization trans-activator n=1 Tax=Purpureocillium lavendulum TaxID=1247861 RepID=A0AB34G114_9HYPO|nr:Proline utilization trans-activator [Purpureocillium lavendulum]